MKLEESTTNFELPAHLTIPEDLRELVVSSHRGPDESQFPTRSDFLRVFVEGPNSQFLGSTGCETNGKREFSYVRLPPIVPNGLAPNDRLGNLPELAFQKHLEKLLYSSLSPLLNSSNGDGVKDGVLFLPQADQVNHIAAYNEAWTFFSALSVAVNCHLHGEFRPEQHRIEGRRLAERYSNPEQAGEYFREFLEVPDDKLHFMVFNPLFRDETGQLSRYAPASVYLVNRLSSLTGEADEDASVFSYPYPIPGDSCLEIPVSRPSWTPTITPIPKSSTDITFERAENFRLYIRDEGGGSVCTFAQAAEKSGRIMYSELPAFEVSNPHHVDGLGTFPELQNSSEVFQVIYEGVQKLDNREVDALIFIPPTDPQSHTEAHNLTWAIYSELLASAELITKPEFIPATARVRQGAEGIARDFADPHKLDEFVHGDSGGLPDLKGDGLYLVGMGPNYHAEPKPHARWSPVMAWVVTRDSDIKGAQRGAPDQAEAIGNKISESVEVMYSGGAPYVVPDNPLFDHSVVKDLGRVLREVCKSYGENIFTKEVRLVAGALFEDIKARGAYEIGDDGRQRAAVSVPQLLEAAARHGLVKPEFIGEVDKGLSVPNEAETALYEIMIRENVYEVLPFEEYQEQVEGTGISVREPEEGMKVYFGVNEQRHPKVFIQDTEGDIRLETASVLHICDLAALRHQKESGEIVYFGAEKRKSPLDPLLKESIGETVSVGIPNLLKNVGLGEVVGGGFSWKPLVDIQFIHVIQYSPGVEVLIRTGRLGLENLSYNPEEIQERFGAEAQKKADLSDSAKVRKIPTTDIVATIVVHPNALQTTEHTDISWDGDQLVRNANEAQEILRESSSRDVLIAQDAEALDSHLRKFRIYM